MTALALSFEFPFLKSEPLQLSQNLLHALGIRVSVQGAERIPADAPMIVVSNHRSALDAPVLMTGLRQNIYFAYHQYMANVPILQDVVEQFGGFPLVTPRHFVRQASNHLQQQQTIGIFPEGAKPMVTVQPPRSLNPFHRGFAYLAMRAAIRPVALLPVALVSDQPGIETPVPLRLLSWFAPNEPLFQQQGGHPLVLYRDVQVRVGTPIWVTVESTRYQWCSQAKQVQQLTDECWLAVRQLLQT